MEEIEVWADVHGPKERVSYKHVLTLKEGGTDQDLIGGWWEAYDQSGAGWKCWVALAHAIIERDLKMELDRHD